MKAIYEPKGAAKEYADFACNLYRGCGHGCIYCYAPAVLRMDKKEFFNNPQPRKGIIEALKRDAKKIGDKYKQDKLALELSFGSLRAIQENTPKRPEVFLCLACDPYQPINKEHQLTRQAIEILHANDLAVNILTKGTITDFDLLFRRPELSKVGITITGGNYSDREPFTEAEIFRLLNLEKARGCGIKTWVSMEPVIDPDVCLEVLRRSVPKIVDEFKIGKWNYSKEADKINWYKFTSEAIALLEKLGCKYVIKESLQRYIAK